MRGGGRVEVIGVLLVLLGGVCFVWVCGHDDLVISEVLMLALKRGQFELRPGVLSGFCCQFVCQE